MRIIVNGALGHMGRALISLIEAQDLTVAARIDRSAASEDEALSDISLFDGDADVVIDFSHHSAAPDLAEYCAGRGLPLVVATTGHTPEELAAIDRSSKAIPVFRSANMSLGIALLRKLVTQAAAVLSSSDIELVDVHHNRKLDAPSGTALMLTEAVQASRPDIQVVHGRSGMDKRGKDEMTVHSLRMGNVVGDHEVIFATANETVRLKHEAHDRSLFADGALRAAAFLVKQELGLYDMDDLLDEIT